MSPTAFHPPHMSRVETDRQRSIIVRLYQQSPPPVRTDVPQNSCTLLRRLKFSAIFLHHLVRWPSADVQVKFYGDRPRGTPPSGELNTKGVAEYSDFGPIERWYLGQCLHQKGDN